MNRFRNQHAPLKDKQELRLCALRTHSLGKGSVKDSIFIKH